MQFRPEMIAQAKLHQKILFNNFAISLLGNFAIKIRYLAISLFRYLFLVEDFSNLACTNGTSTFADSETETLAHGDF